MTSTRPRLAVTQFVPRFAVIGAAAALVLGGLVGLVLGLHAHPATAWFAVFEVGVPAGIAGAALGAFVGLVAVIVERINRHPGADDGV
jgi:ABC-type uncharacterized transport system permease subunit